MAVSALTYLRIHRYRYTQYNKNNTKYYNSNGGRELSRYNFELVDCDVCTKMNCFYAEYGQTQTTSSSTVGDWVDTIAQCQVMDSYFVHLYEMYAGFMCNQDGTGVDIALFLDDACSIYNSNVGYKEIASGDDQTSMVSATDMITYTFLHQMNCNGDYAYLSIDEYKAQAQTYSYSSSSNNNNNYDATSSYCTALFEGGSYGQAVSLKDCNQDDVADAEEVDPEVTQYYDSDYNWYQFTLSYDASLDTEQTCVIMRNLQGQYETVYRWSGSGQIYNYGTGPTTVSSIMSSYRDKMGPSMIAAIVCAVLVALTACCCVLWSFMSPDGVVVPSKIEEHKTLDTKRESLVDSSTGILM